MSLVGPNRMHRVYSTELFMTAHDVVSVMRLISCLQFPSATSLLGMLLHHDVRNNFLVRVDNCRAGVVRRRFQGQYRKAAVILLSE